MNGLREILHDSGEEKNGGSYPGVEQVRVIKQAEATLVRDYFCYNLNIYLILHSGLS